MSEYKSSLFIDQVAIEQQDLLCPICMGVFQCPVDIGCPQGHTLCQVCFQQYIDEHSKPRELDEAIEREVVELSDSENGEEESVGKKISYQCPLRCGCMKLTKSRPNRHVARLVARQKIKCINSEATENSCSWIGVVSDLDAHLDADCAFELLQCEGCNSDVIRSEMDKHCEQCPLIEIDCPLDCGDIFERRYLDKHTKKCPNAVIKCKNSILGCSHTSVRQSMRKHLTMCEYRMVRCSFEKYGCKHVSTFKTRQQHLVSSKLNHLELKSQYLERLLEQRKESDSERDKQIQSLTKKVKKLEQILSKR